MEIDGRIGNFGEVPIFTDHRMRKQDAFYLTAGFPSIDHVFADRSMVREGCTCGYCTWTPPPIVPLMSGDER